ncbi:hypothetical protein N0V92_004160 [Colletotrichum tropicale]|nr:hypothetical protein N0V92_004160 [Colletotrichum tropicale]
MKSDNNLFEAKIEITILDEVEALANILRHTLFAYIDFEPPVPGRRFHSNSSRRFPVNLDYVRWARQRRDKAEKAAVEAADMAKRAERTAKEAEKAFIEAEKSLQESKKALKKSKKTSSHDSNTQREINNDFHYLVDQITATVAQIAIRVSESNYWLVIVLACLAKLAAKMKVLHLDFAGFIEFTIDRARHWDHSESEEPDRFKKHSMLSDDSPVIERHVREHFIVTSWLAECILAVLYNLGARRPWWKEDNCVDSCALVFDAGLKPTRTMIYENSHGRISGTSDKIALSFSSVALETVWRLSNMVTSRTLNSPPETITNEQPEVYIELHLDLEQNIGETCRLNKPDRPMQLRRIIDYIVLMIPLSLTDPLIGDGYRNTLQEISSLSAFGVPNTRQIDIHGK